MITKEELLQRIAEGDPAYKPNPNHDYQAVTYTATLESIADGVWIVNTPIGTLLVTNNLHKSAESSQFLKVTFEYWLSVPQIACWIRLATEDMQSLASKYRCFTFSFATNETLAEKLIEYKL